MKITMHESGGDERMVLFTRSEIEDWKEAGLWRDREPQP